MGPRILKVRGTSVTFTPFQLFIFYHRSVNLYSNKIVLTSRFLFGIFRIILPYTSAMVINGVSTTVWVNKQFNKSTATTVFKTKGPLC